MAAPKLIDANPPYLYKTGVKSASKYTNVFVLDPEGDTIDPGALSADIADKIEAASPVELLRMILIEMTAMRLLMAEAFDGSADEFRQAASDLVDKD